MIKVLTNPPEQGKQGCYWRFLATSSYGLNKREEIIAIRERQRQTEREIQIKRLTVSHKMLLNLTQQVLKQTSPVEVLKPIQCLPTIAYTCG